MYFCKYTALLTGGNSTHKTSAGARTGIVWCLDGHRPVPGRATADLLRDFRMLLVLSRHLTVFGRSPLKSHDFNFKQNLPVPVYLTSPGTVRCLKS